MNVPKDLFYTKEHEWARLSGKTAHVGITDHAQAALGDITFVGLPKKGEVLKKTGTSATVESVKAASDVYAPFSGKVIATNDELSAHPELVNKSPYDKGYFFSMEISDESEKNGLMDAKAYASYLEGISK